MKNNILTLKWSWFKNRLHLVAGTKLFMWNSSKCLIFMILRTWLQSKQTMSVNLVARLIILSGALEVRELMHKSCITMSLGYSLETGHNSTTTYKTVFPLNNFNIISREICTDISLFISIQTSSCKIVEINRPRSSEEHIVMYIGRTELSWRINSIN